MKSISLSSGVPELLEYLFDEAYPVAEMGVESQEANKSAVATMVTVGRVRCCFMEPNSPRVVGFRK